MNALATTARLLAIIIAVLAAVDPAITSMRRTKPEIAVVNTSRLDSALARQVSDRLAKDYTVIRGPYDGAAATVIVGRAIPDHPPAGAVIGVMEARPVSISRFDAPPAVTPRARAPVSLGGRAAPGAQVEVELHADDVLVDRATVTANAAGQWRAPLTLTPPRQGAIFLHGRAGVGRDSAIADIVVESTDRPQAILFFDRRPSWMSTFVRRALERDARVLVASRVVTSRNVSTDAGQPPSSLSDPLVAELYQAVIVGAPEALTAGDVAGLERFLRNHGGAVVLLFDEAPKGGAYDRLTGITGWASATTQSPVIAAGSGDTLAFRLTEAAWPVEVPANAIVRAKARVNGSDRPVVWSTMIGQGELIVSTALDAWKYRDPATSGFEQFWEATISRAARDAAMPVKVEIIPNLVRPGEEVIVRATTRDTVQVIGEQNSGDVFFPIEMRPTDGRTEWEGRRMVGPRPGEYEISVGHDEVSGRAGYVVRETFTPFVPDDSLAIAAVARASSGTITRPEGVEREVRARVSASRRVEDWRPMREPWWVLVFAGLLGVEWFLRRRRGVA